MGLSVEQVVWMEVEWNWPTIMSNSGFYVYAMDSNEARLKKFQHLPDPMSGVTIIGLDVIIRYCYNNNNNNNIYLTATGLSPGGSGFEHIYKYLKLCY